MKVVTKCVAALLALGMSGIAAPAAAQEKIVVWWVKGFYPSEDAALYEAVKKFEAKTGVKVDLSQYAVQDGIPKTVAALDSGNPPDVAYIDVYDFQVLGKWAYEGKLEDLTDVLTPIKGKLPAQHRSRRRTCTTTRRRSARITAFPIKQQTMHIEYWKDMLAEAGDTSDSRRRGRSTGRSGATRRSPTTARRPASGSSAPASRWASTRATRTTRS